MHNSDITMDQITKVEGSASLEVRIRGGAVEHVYFKSTEYKRFFTQAMRGKAVLGVSQLLARICGTCSNAHLICSIEAAEKALGIKPSVQTDLLRILTMFGLMIRDHALHLYLFVLPDVFGKDSFLEFDESDSLQNQLLHDGFEIKAAGNYLSTIIAGRSVHGPYPAIGGFTHFPAKEEIYQVIDKLKAARPASLRLIDVFLNSPFHFDRKTNFLALTGKRYDFLRGEIISDKGYCIPKESSGKYLERTVLPYSQASGYKFKGETYMVGALARVNLAKEKLNPETKKSAKETLSRFPSTDIFYNNLAQAIEVLHCIDESIEILSHNKFLPESVIKKPFLDSVGVGVIEAPRGTLYHKLIINKQGLVKEGEIVVPTGQNQINIEQDIFRLVEELLPDTTKDKIIFEIEKLIRAYDPCISCASHFLKVNWFEV